MLKTQANQRAFLATPPARARATAAHISPEKIASERLKGLYITAAIALIATLLQATILA